MKNEHGGILLCAAVPLHGVVSSLVYDRRKETAALIFAKPPHQMGVSNGLLYDGFFSFAVVRQIDYFLLL